MTTALLLLLISVTVANAVHIGAHHERDKRELLVRSKRRWVLSTIEIEEGDEGPFPKRISTMFNDQSDDERKTHKYRISGMGVTQEPLNVFKIDEDTGEVKVLKTVDRETHRFFHIKFDILDRVTGETKDKELAFDVEVKDINDNPPRFMHGRMKGDVKENVQEGFLPVSFEVTDIDQENTSNSMFTVRVLSQTPLLPKFTVKKITDITYRLQFEGCFNYEQAKMYQLIMEAKDKGIPSLSSTAAVTVHIINTNSHPPMFKEKHYHGEVQEMSTVESVLRVGVEDRDSPGTPGWRAKYTIIEGNEDANYMIRTDPDTNEGILSVIKGKDFERTTNKTLIIGVENEEPLHICNNFKDRGSKQAVNFKDTVNITIKVIDVNDPPHFEKVQADLYVKEEEEPGKLLYTPKAHDVELDQIRFILLEDPADWITINKKTGAITSTKKMDRESPFVHDSIYKVLIGAVDNGEPPATGTGTVLIHLTDMNDNVPKLVKNDLLMCGNKVNKVTLKGQDNDIHPFTGPFSFALDSNDPDLKSRWKLDPAFGEEAVLMSLRELPFANYSVPLVIKDQQGVAGSETVEVMVCDCGEGSVCRSKDPLSTRLGPAGIGLLCLGFLMFLLLLLLLICKCGENDFKHMPIVQDGGNQSLIKYNQEGGGAECKSDPIRLLTPTNGIDVTDGIKMATKQMSQMSPVMSQDMDTFNSGFNMMNTNMTSLGRNSQSLKAGGGHGGSWAMSRTNTYHGGSSKYNRSVSLRSNQHIADHLDRRLYMINGTHVDHPEYRPREFTYEGQGSKCQSLDGLSLSNMGDDLNFLNDLGPKFKTLGTICRHTVQEKRFQPQ